MDDIPVPISINKLRLTDKLRKCMREKHLAYTTEKTYLYWILNFTRPAYRKKPPVVLSHSEAMKIITNINSDTSSLITKIGKRL